MTLLQHYYFSLFLTTAVTWILGLWVLFKQPHNKVARIWVLYAIAVGYWTFCQARAGATQDPHISLLWIRAMFPVMVAFPILLTYLFSTFLDIRRKKVILAGCLLVAILYPFLYSEWFLKSGGPIGFLPTLPRAGSFFPILNLGWFIWSAYNMFLLGFQRPGPNSSATRPQIRLLLFAFLFGYATGSINFLYLYGLYIPWFHPFATYGVAIAFLVIAYGILAYGLFEIPVVIKKSLIYSILVTLLTVGYFGFVYGVERISRVTFGYQSIRVSLAAFALMAFLFQPLKIWIQRFVDWLIFGKSQEQLAKRIERLEAETLQTEKLRAVSTLAAGMAHEIKNPLTAIHTFAEFVPEKYADPEFARKLHEVLTTETRRIQRIVQEVLDFAKPKAPRIQTIDPKILLNSTLDLLSGDLLRKRIHCQIDCRHNGAQIHADPDQLRQVLINLIQNAADAMPNGGKLSIATQSVNSHLELTVSDTGHGIPSKLLPQIFDPFVTTKVDGNGLGLAMVHSIIRAHGGTIHAESPSHLPANGSVAGGTTFTISLPL